jgi:hypothetical protein
MEEEHRLLRERVAMQDWMIEEWNRIERAQQCIGECNCYRCQSLMLKGDLDEDSSLMYQLHCRKISLARLCSVWQKKMQEISFPCLEAFPASWGPSESDILLALRLEYTASWEWNHEEEEEEEEEELEMTDEGDGEIWDILETVTLEAGWHDDSLILT